MKDLTSGSIYKNFILFTIPMVLSAVLSQLHSTVDTIIAGKFLGETGLAATGATSAFLTMISCMMYGFGTGFGVYAARIFGQKDYKRLKSEVYNMLIFSGIFIEVIGIIMCLCVSPVIDILEVDPAIIKETKQYYTIFCLGFAFIIQNGYFIYIMNALGSSGFPFIISIISTFLNITGNILTITVFGWGVAGVALSTVFSTLVTNIINLIHLKKCFTRLEIPKERFKFDMAWLKNSYRYCLPSVFQQGVMYFASVIMSPIVNGIGKSATASYTVVIRIYNLSAAIYQNAAKTLSNFVSQSIGAKKLKQINKGLVIGFVQGVLFILPLLLVSVFGAEFVCEMFFSSDTSKQAVKYAVVFSKYYMPFIVLNLANNLFHAYFRGIGEMKFLFISTLIGSVSRIAASFILVEYFEMYGVFAGWALSWGTELIITLFVFFISFSNTEKIKKHIKSA